MSRFDIGLSGVMRVTMYGTETPDWQSQTSLARDVRATIFLNLTWTQLMMPTRISTTALAILAAFSLAACSDGTGPDRTPLTVDDVFNDIDEVQSVTAATTVFAGAPMASHTLPPSASCSFNTTSQSFVCPTTTATGLSFARSFQLFNASGETQGAFDPATTAAIRALSDASGTLTNQNGSVQFTSHDDYTVSGLLQTNLELDGSSTSHSVITNTENSQTVTIDATTTVKDLILPRRRSGNRYPLGGTIESDIAMSNGQNSTDVSIGVAFNGTSIATMTMSTGLGTITCHIDLSRQNKAPNCS